MSPSHAHSQVPPTSLEGPGDGYKHHVNGYFLCAIGLVMISLGAAAGICNLYGL